jgi:hypothetical protein
MAHIVMPTTATRQGGAFEDLILSHYRRSGQYTVREWSTYLHGASGQWWQCDGIIEDSRTQYAPYTPYAKSLFNPNKTEGLLRLYRLFGA